MGEAVGGIGEGMGGLCGNSRCFLINFSVNLKLL